MTQVRIREVVASMRVVDEDSLLSEDVMERIVAAVMLALRCEQRDTASRRRDVQIGSCRDGCGQRGDSDGSLP